MCRVEYSEGLHDSSFPLLSTSSRPLSTCFRSDCTVSDIPHNRFRFPDRAFPFPFPFPNKNMKTKIVRAFSRSIPTAFIPTECYAAAIRKRLNRPLKCQGHMPNGNPSGSQLSRRSHWPHPLPLAPAGVPQHVQLQDQSTNFKSPE